MRHSAEWTRNAEYIQHNTGTFISENIREYNFKKIKRIELNSNQTECKESKQYPSYIPGFFISDLFKIQKTQIFGIFFLFKNETPSTAPMEPNKG